jgi:hypothetical protein
MHYLVLKFKEREVGMDEGLHYYKPQAYKIERTNQNKIKYKLLIWFFLPPFFM